MKCWTRVTFWAALFLLLLPAPLTAQEPIPAAPPAVAVQNDSVTIRLIDADLRAAVQALGRHLDRPIIFGAVQGARITLETPRPVPRAQVIGLLRGVLESQNLELIEEADALRIRSREERRPRAEPSSPAQGAAGAIQLYVIRLQHARAADVAATVNALYGRAAALGELGGPATLSEELRENRVPPGVSGGSAPEAVTVGGVASLSGDVTIVPDPRTNSLLVRASPRDYGLIRAAVSQVDVRPLQVLIEVLIAEVRRDRAFAFGVDAKLPEINVPGTTDTRVGGSTAGLGLGDFALSVMNIGGVDLDVTLRAAASRGDVSILSRPVVLTTNNEPAEILVGSQRPFVQVQRALPTDLPVRDQVIQYKDVGTELNVLPTISGDGYVMLEVTQEVNAATTETAFDAPVISTRSVRTRLLVKDGQTAVLGGLADRQRDATRAGVPILSSIPLIGGLFGRTSRRTVETELFLFLTPRVVRSDEELENLTTEVRTNAHRVDKQIREHFPIEEAADSINIDPVLEPDSIPR